MSYAIVHSFIAVLMAIVAEPTGQSLGLISSVKRLLQYLLALLRAAAQSVAS